MRSPSDEVGALTKASETQGVVQVIGAEFTIQGTVTMFSMGNGANFRVVRFDWLNTIALFLTGTNAVNVLLERCLALRATLPP